ncbi:MAG: manganese efflux pump [Candidatus Omnitrophica bacterium]|nr:manganese efflux pump [Candidatus Omnitrophota bacterium]
MSLVVIFMTAVGLAMDAFAVALASGSAVAGSRWRHALRLGGAFGLAQMLMPLIGWFLGFKLKSVITSFDHWIAFGLLVFIGVKMLRESFSADDCVRSPEPLTARRLLVLAVATSIDALAVGVTFAFLDCPVVQASVIIGVVTFVIAGAGALIGAFCCCLWGRQAERLGGIILILIGAKILVEHLWTI